MPTYQYQCKDCGEPLEAVQAFTDAALTTCPQCSGPLRRVYGSVGVVFKGSGFYRTDNRAKRPGGARSSSLAANADVGSSSSSNTSAGAGTTSPAPATAPATSAAPASVPAAAK